VGCGIFLVFVTGCLYGGWMRQRNNHDGGEVGVAVLWGPQAARHAPSFTEQRSGCGRAVVMFWLKCWAAIWGFAISIVVVVLAVSVVMANRYGEAGTKKVEAWGNREYTRICALAVVVEIVAVIGFKAIRARRKGTAKRRAARAKNRLPVVSGAGPVADWCASRGGGVLLGTAPSGDLTVARGEHAVLVLGPPRSGKTVSIVIPAVVTAPGPVLVTSTKPEVMQLCAATVRARGGRCWLFDPTGTEQAADGVELMSWSPIDTAGRWDDAVAMARAMVATSSTTMSSDGNGVGGGHWAERGASLLAPMLHAAWHAGATVQDLYGWVARHDLDTPTTILNDVNLQLIETNQTVNGEQVSETVRVAPITADDHAARLGIRFALDSLALVTATEDRERSGIFSTVANVLGAYTTVGAVLAATDHARLNPAGFVGSRDVIFVCAPAHAQTITAPLIVGLIETIRNYTYAAARLSPGGQLWPPVRLVLDEAANIAPIPFLPQLASEAGGQGLQLITVFQDLAQARWRWPTQADGFLSLFGTKILLPGIGDKTTLEAISTMIGDWDRPVQTTGISRTHLHMNNIPVPINTPSESWTTNRQPLLTPGDIANIPTGHGLVLAANMWNLVRLNPWWTAPLNLTTTEQRPEPQQLVSGRRERLVA
jgi:type IV secretion system protein VirD4